MEFTLFSSRGFLTLLVVMGCILNVTYCLGVPGWPLLDRKGRHFEKISSNILKAKMNTASIGEFEEHKYTQTLDHFGYRPEGYMTFPQRYFINNVYWGGPSNRSPIFVYLGAESSIVGALALGINEYAPRWKGLLVYIEHRYYGTSMPFRGEEGAYSNTSTLGYFTATQALADYATFIIDLKKNLSAENCPVIVVGASYGGMLAAWFRLKYPHVTIGALASSAPILYFDDITPEYGYNRVVTMDFKNASENCYKTINQSWSEMDKIAEKPGGLITLSKLFNTCQNLSDRNDLNDLYYWLAGNYKGAAQYYFEKVQKICKTIDDVPADVSTVSRIVAVAKYLKGAECLNLTDQDGWDVYDGWSWQTCTEMVIPMGNPQGKTMFPPSPFDIKAYARQCYLRYGVLPRPHWATTEFGGHNIKRVLKNFGSNIIFSNGLRDPWSSGGVLKNISDTIIAIFTHEGTHCQDIIPSYKDDPEWLKDQRSKEATLLQKWIDDYKSMLLKDI